MSTTLWILLSLFAGVFGFLFILPLFPTAIKKLANEPNEFRQEDGTVTEVSEFGFFTGIEPRQVKIIEREGGGFTKCIMRFEGYNFKGNCEDLPSGSSEHWDVVNTVEGRYETSPDAHPITPPVLFKREFGPIGNLLSFLTYYPVRKPFWAWKRYVYATTGYVFTGIYPYRKVRAYRVERLTGDFKKKVDFSDHFRVGDFEFPVLVSEADTTDKVRVSARLTIIARVYNPYEVAYGTDNWSSRLTTAIEGTVSDFTKIRRLSQVLTASNAETADDLAEAVMKIGNPRNRTAEENGEVNDGRVKVSVIPKGLEILKVIVADVSMVEPRNDLERQLADVALAEVYKDAKEIRAQGDAAQLARQIEVVQKAGHVGLATLAAERDVRVATAAGERATVIIGGGGNTDPIQLAILQELKDKNLRNKILGEE